MTIQYLADGNPDGTVIGGSSDKLGFFGLATPVVKITTVTAANATSIGNALVSYGLIATGG